MKKVAVIIFVLTLYALFILGFTFAYNNKYVRSTFDKIGLTNEAIDESNFELGEFGDPNPPPPGGGP